MKKYIYILALFIALIFPVRLWASSVSVSTIYAALDDDTLDSSNTGKSSLTVSVAEGKSIICAVTFNASSTEADASTIDLTLTPQISAIAGSTWLTAGNYNYGAIWTGASSKTETVNTGMTDNGSSFTTKEKLTAGSSLTARLQIEGIKQGSATFTITSGTRSATITVRVTAPQAPKFSTSEILDSVSLGYNFTSNPVKIQFSNYDIDTDTELELAISDSNLDSFGLDFDPGTARLTGTANIAGEAKFKITASFRGKSSVRIFKLSISGTAPTITGPNNLTGNISSIINASGIPAGTTITASSGFTFTATGTREGLSISGTITVNGKTATDLTFTAGTVQSSGTYNGTIRGTLTGTLDASITSQRTYTIKITATNAEGSSSKTFTLTSVPSPSITDTAGKTTFTWGKANSYTPSAVNITSWEIDATITGDDYITELPSWLTLSSTAGTLSGTWADHDTDDIALGSKSSVSKKIRLIGTNGTTTKSTDITLVFAGISPKITEPSDKDYSSLKYNEDIGEIIFTAEGPGIISWDIGTLPEGLSYDVEADATESTTSTLKITGTPSETFAAKSITISAKNGAGTGKVSPAFTVTADELTLEAELPEGSVKKGDEFTTITLKAYPGPIKWEASNLPGGITLSWDKTGDTTIAELYGKSYTKATTIDKNGQSVYTVTATNTNFSSLTKTVSADLRVYDSTTISVKSLGDVTIGKNYTASLKASNNPTDWIVKFSTLSEDIADNGTEEYTADNASKCSLTWDNENLAITGSLDRIPDNGKFYVYVQAGNTAGSDVKIYSVNVKGTAPSLKTSTIPTITGSSGGTVNIQASGTLPIDITAYIDAKTAKTLFGLDGTVSIDLTDENNITGFTFTPETETNEGTSLEEGTGNGTLIFSPEAGTSYKALPITFSMKNPASTKIITKALKATVKGTAPAVCIMIDNELVLVSKDMTINVTASQDIGEYIFVASGDNPLSITSSQKLGEKYAKNGIYITSQDTDTSHAIVIQGTPTKGKETKTLITVTAKNISTNEKTSRKITISAAMPPEITTKAKALMKEVELTKSISLKFAAKGTTPITWSVSDEDGNDATDILTDLGLKLNPKTGTISGTAKKPTVDENDNVYASKDLYITASNSAGDSEQAKITIGIKGAKPKFSTSPVNLERPEPDFDGNRIATMNIKSDNDNANVQYSPANAKAEAALSGLGLAVARSESNTGILEESGNIIATKGTSIKFKAENYGTEATGSVKIVITDPAPEIADDDIGSLEASATAKAETSITLTLTDETMPTGDTKIQWVVLKKPVKGITAKLKDNKNGTALLTISVPKKFKNAGDQDFSANVTIKAANQTTRKFATKDFPFTVSPYIADNSAQPADNSSRPELEPEAAPEDSGTSTAKTEGMLMLGTARDTGNISANERAFLQEKGCSIAAVLPEISADISGQYDIEATLDDSAEVGAKLFWLAFPKDGIDRPDDEIADFLSVDGEYIENVPEERNIIVSPWLTEGVIYAPVIAVKE